MQTLELKGIATLTVRDVMQQHVSTVHADAPVAEAARTLWDEHIGGAPVVDVHGRTIGFISASDVVRHKAYGVRYRPPQSLLDAGRVIDHDIEVREPLPPRLAGSEARARDLMTPATLSVHADTSLPDLARFLLNAGIHRVLVQEMGRTIGIVSAYDIVRAVAGMSDDVMT